LKTRHGKVVLLSPRPNVVGVLETTQALQSDRESLRATIEDDGRPFNPLEKEAPPIPRSLEEAGIGGWGIPIVRTFADELAYQRRDGRNSVTIVSQAPSRPA